MESLLTPFGTILNKFFKMITLSRWHRIYGSQYDQVDFKVAFKSKDHVSKNHPRHFQRKVMDRYAQKLSDFGKENNMAWQS
jgi:hypothetical protein